MATPYGDPIHVDTLVWAALVVYFAGFLFSLALFLVRKTFSGSRQWILGQFFLLVGAFGSGVRLLGWAYGGLLVGDLAYIASGLLLAHAIWRFRGRENFPMLTYFAIPAGALTWFALGKDGAHLYSIALSGLICAIALWDAILLLRKPDPFYRRVFALASVFFLMSAGSAAGRLVYALAGEPSIAIEFKSGISVWIYTAAILGVFFNMFGYFLMSAVRTERELRESQLAIGQRNEKLNRLVALKDSLITVVGHDLRAPISSAARYTRNHLLAYQGDLNDKRESIATLAEGLERAATLLANLVDWARSASGRADLALERCDLAALARESAKDLAAVAERKGLTLDVSGDGACALAEPRACATVFRNLLANAIKYSRSGASIDVRFGVEPDGRVAASVIDHGVGMDRGQMATLFEPGRTVQTLGTDGEQGTGMGLALCKAFMESMGGDIRVSSAPGAGSRFELLFHPASEPCEPDEPSPVIAAP